MDMLLKCFINGLAIFMPACLFVALAFLGMVLYFDGTGIKKYIGLSMIILFFIVIVMIAGYGVSHGTV